MRIHIDTNLDSRILPLLGVFALFSLCLAQLLSSMVSRPPWCASTDHAGCSGSLWSVDVRAFHSLTDCLSFYFAVSLNVLGAGQRTTSKSKGSKDRLPSLVNEQLAAAVLNCD